jgi:hypothetical protein
MGIISAQLLLEKYPGNLKRAKKSTSDMLAIAERGNWELDGIRSKAIRELVKACVNFVPENRPTAVECIGEICRELERHHGQPIIQLLEQWRKEPTRVQEAEHISWAAPRAAALSAFQASAVYEDLWQRIKETTVCDLESAEIWAELAISIGKVAKAVMKESSDEIRGLREQARNYLAVPLSDIDANDTGKVFVRTDSLGLMQPYERFANVVDALSQVAAVDYDLAVREGAPYSASVLSLMAYCEAFRSKAVPEAREKYLGISIQLTPSQAVPYYFRVEFAYQEFLLNGVLNPNDQAKVPSGVLQKWKADLKTAINLAPEWSEPRKRLAEISDIAPYR